MNEQEQKDLERILALDEQRNFHHEKWMEIYCGETREDSLKKLREHDELRTVFATEIRKNLSLVMSLLRTLAAENAALTEEIEQRIQAYDIAHKQALSNGREALLAKDEVAAIQARAEWQSIDTAPRDETPIDIFSVSEGRLTDYHRVEYSPKNIFYIGHEGMGYCIRDATHWMPLPTPPAEE